MEWKKGRGKLGVFAPLIGQWLAKAASPMGPVECRRTFSRTLNDKYVELRANWKMADSEYDEVALFGVDAGKNLCFWSFTSDGKQAHGVLADVSDLHPDAFGFEANMPGGLARQAYWPHPKSGFLWVVEAQTKKGWNRIVEHHYNSA